VRLPSVASNLGNSVRAWLKGSSYLVVLLCLTGAFIPPSAECPKQFLGAWEYRQKAGEGYDEEGERLEKKLTSAGVTRDELYLRGRLKRR
jgi:hypothetical protein